MEEQERLRNLSAEDAEELRAFLEKRKWFEGKLELLERADPIYPFVHPVLELAETSTSFRRVGEEGSPYRLPTLEGLKVWQDERDALEEEILAFDGGDLGRMKQKTRAITVVPLTPPSTELVEITLVLIVLIDKLLVLLRRRGDVLELTRTRLKWDELRWRLKLEIDRLEGDIQNFPVDFISLDNEAQKEPVGVVSPQREVDSHPADPTTSMGLPETPRRPATRTEKAMRLSPTVFTPDPSRQTPSHLPSSPSLSLDSPAHRDTLSGPRSHPIIADFQVRRRQIASLTERSGKYLDRMIDQAKPLPDLGCASGPIASGAQGTNSGAVPDELLDVQDELDAKPASLKQKIIECKEILKRHEAIQASSKIFETCREEATQVLEQVGIAFSDPAAPWHLKESTDMLERNRLAVSRQAVPNWAGIPADREEAGFAAALAAFHASRRGAEMALTDAQEALNFHQRVLNGWTEVHELDGRLQTGMSDLERATAGLQPFCGLLDLAKIRSFTSASLGDLPRMISVAENSVSAAEDALQKADLSHHRHRYLLNAVPRSLAAPSPARLALFSASETAADAARNDLQQSKILVQEAKGPALMGPLLLTALTGTEAVEPEVHALLTAICTAIDTSAWRSDPAAGVDRQSDLVAQLAGLEERHRREVVEPLVRLRPECLEADTIGDGEALDDLTRRSEKIESGLSRCRRLATLLDAVRDQADAVRVAQAEADRLMSCIIDNPKDMDISVERSPTRTAGMPELAEAWSASLATKVRMVSAAATTLPEVGDSTAGSDVLQISDGAGSKGYLTDLADLDARVRGKVNDLSSRVMASLASSNSADAAAHAPQMDGDVHGRSISGDLEEESLPLNSDRQLSQLEGDGSDDDEALPDSPTKRPTERSTASRIPSLSRDTSRLSMSGSSAAPSPQMGSPSMIPTLRSGQLRSSPATTRFYTVSDRQRVASMRSSLGHGPNQGGSSTLAAGTRQNRSSLPSAMQLFGSGSPGLTTASPRRRPVRPYDPDQRSELDVAVGSIVNKLKVNIPIVPVRISIGDDWEDQSGKYWIGTEGRAKLCFCRILRSKTVMVRVGGGWVELSSFLLDHFADAFWQTAEDSMAPLTPRRSSGLQHGSTQLTPRIPAIPGSGTPTADTARAPPTSRMPSEVGNGTPSIGLEGLPGVTAAPQTPSRSGTVGILASPSHLQSPSLGSPLLPLQFLRKASESPPIREKEKELYRNSRRSILGRESAPSSPTKPVIRSP